MSNPQPDPKEKFRPSNQSCNNLSQNRSLERGTTRKTPAIN